MGFPKLSLMFNCPQHTRSDVSNVMPHIYLEKLRNQYNEYHVKDRKYRRGDETGQRVEIQGIQ